MATCTFFGHRDLYENIDERLKTTIIHLVENCNVDYFIVGNQGSFDFRVHKILDEIKKEYNHIDYSVILAYLPGKKEDYSNIDYTKTLYPEGIEKVPRKFAISWRNKWMIQKSDYVVVYVIKSYGGASQWYEFAKKRNKTTINIAEI